jgi:spermidine/putrescine transport system permease protein
MPRALRIYVGLYIVFLYLPMALIPLFSFNDSIQAAFPLKGFTFAWYRVLFDNERLHAALGNTLIVGTVAATLATGCGTLIAYASARRRGRPAPVIAAVARLPLLIPGVIIGIALLIAVNLIRLGPSLTAIVLGHTVICLPIAFSVMRAGFEAVPRNLEEAAMDLGANEWAMFRRVVLPLVLPAMLSSFLLTFITSFDEFIAAFFLTGTDVTLPIFIWTQLRFPRELPGVMALGSIILAVSIAFVAAAEIVRRRGAFVARAASSA